MVSVAPLPLRLLHATNRLAQQEGGTKMLLEGDFLIRNWLYLGELRGTRILFIWPLCGFA